MLGQHLLKRLHTRSVLRGLYLCGESTVMGTGTPTVTTSGISAANAVLAKEGLAPFRYQKDMPNFVTTAQSPMTKDKLYSAFPQEQREVMTQAMSCRFCEHPSCSKTLDGARHDAARARRQHPRRSDAAEKVRKDRAA